MGILSNLFKKQPKLDAIDLSLLQTDMHSHLIPGIDDGAKTMDESLALLRRFSELGFKKVVTTPHVMSDYYRNTPEIILNGLKEVRAAIQEHNIPIEIEAAAEYYLDEHFHNLIAKKELLTFGNNHVLFELSFTEQPPRIKDAIFNMITEGFTPILAHIERYPFFINEMDTLKDYKNRGCLLQFNINSLSGQYGPHVKKWAQEIVDSGIVDVVGSDCHHMGHLEMLNDLRTNRFVHKLVQNPQMLNRSL